MDHNKITLVEFNQFDDCYPIENSRINKIRRKSFHDLSECDIKYDEILGESKSLEDVHFVYESKSFEGNLHYESELTISLTEEIEVTTTNVIEKTYQNELDEILSNPEKSKLLFKAIELGFSVENIKTCLKNSKSVSNEEKFFERLLDLSIKNDNKSNVTQKDELKMINDKKDLLLNNVQEYKVDDKILQKTELELDSKSNLRPIVLDGNDVGYR
jgi:hypothetical protein